MIIETEHSLGNTALVFLHRTRIRSQVVYIVTLLATVLALAALPFIYTTISVKGTGILLNASREAVLPVPTGGWLVSIKQTQNQRKEEPVKEPSIPAEEEQIHHLNPLQEKAAIRAEIQSDATGKLTASCYVKPSDIGFIQKGQQVRLRIDAFNYKHWGTLSGRVTAISDELTVRDQQSFVEVRCQLDANHLQLKNGYKATLKKGMTFTAAFVLARRSLYELLSDKIENWVNPVLSNE